jgi:hypothetical protein
VFSDRVVGGLEMELEERRDVETRDGVLDGVADADDGVVPGARA